MRLAGRLDGWTGDRLPLRPARAPSARLRPEASAPTGRAVRVNPFNFRSRKRRMADHAVLAYVEWRAQCTAVWDAYRCWMDVGDADAALAYTALRGGARPRGGGGADLCPAHRGESATWWKPASITRSRRRWHLASDQHRHGRTITPIASERSGRRHWRGLPAASQRPATSSSGRTRAQDAAVACIRSSNRTLSVTSRMAFPPSSAPSPHRTPLARSPAPSSWWRAVRRPVPRREWSASDARSGYSPRSATTLD